MTIKYQHLLRTLVWILAETINRSLQNYTYGLRNDLQHFSWGNYEMKNCPYHKRFRRRSEDVLCTWRMSNVEMKTSWHELYCGTPLHRPSNLHSTSHTQPKASNCHSHSKLSTVHCLKISRMPVKSLCLISIREQDKIGFWTSSHACFQDLSSQIHTSRHNSSLAELEGIRIYLEGIYPKIL